MILVLDIDGTLADTSKRDQYIEKDDLTQEDWDAFFDPSRVADDDPIEGVPEALKEVAAKFDHVIFLTGRPDHLRETTVEWLDRHFNMFPLKDELFMRRNDDQRTNSITKQELLEQLEKIYGGEDLVFCDDEDANLELFKDHGRVLKAPECWENMAEKLAAKRAREIIDVPIDKINPLHEVRNEDKLVKLTEAMKQEGWKGRPLVVEPLGEGYQAWTGSHRLPAAKEAGIETIPVLVIDFDKVVAVMRGWGYELDELRHGIGDSLIEDEDRYDILMEAGDKEAAKLMHEEVVSNQLQEVESSARKLEAAVSALQIQ